HDGTTAVRRQNGYIRPMLHLELGIVLILILINGVLAMAELAIVSSRRSRLRAPVERELVGSRRALALAADPGRFLSTVQIGVRLVRVPSGASPGGAPLGLRVPAWLAEHGLPAAARPKYCGDDEAKLRVCGHGVAVRRRSCRAA